MSLTKQERIKRREVRLLLYTLERKWGVPADLYKVVVGTPNYETGNTATTKTKYHVPKLVTHETKFDQKFEYDLSYLAANKNFTYGGVYIPGDRLAILNSKYLPSTFQLSVEDHLIYGGKRYAIQRFEELDAKAGWLLHLRHTTGTKPVQTHERAVWSRVSPSQDIESTLE